jgi:hypothetical protein
MKGFGDGFSFSFSFKGEVGDLTSFSSSEEVLEDYSSSSCDFFFPKTLFGFDFIAFS